MKNTTVWKRGFTLIELLVVIAIIGILAAIIIPSIRGALRTATKTRAQRQVQDLDGALKRYFAEYGRMPISADLMRAKTDLHYSEAKDQAGVIEVLINAEGIDANLNPKHIAFLDLDPKDFGVKTVPEMLVELKSDGYRDPWGNPYGLLLDVNFDDAITGSWTLSLGKTSVQIANLRVKTGVYSLGDPEDEAAGKYLPTGSNPFPPFKTW
ncbi:MAG: type II secretion system protein [Kiritimatiellia bacterium]